MTAFWKAAFWKRSTNIWWTARARAPEECAKSTSSEAKPSSSAAMAASMARSVQVTDRHVCAVSFAAKCCAREDDELASARRPALELVKERATA
ncbi:hypothetical protein [Streptomyces sp. NEAU-L66]|uniref:hypothetical protein n=1 Tax=Streptomyces sp. NEAU-L66 TaxID=3390812 RepID=UPI0039C5F1C0